MPECYLLSYDHGGLVLWGYDHFVSHLRTTLTWLERNPQLKMGLDNEAWAYDWLEENQPAVLMEIRTALERFSERLDVGTCTYGQPLAAFLLEESNLRQIAFGVAATRKHFNQEVPVYSFSEHAAFAQLPQILHGLGFAGALMRTHFAMYGFCPGHNLAVAWWQGLDGSRIACVPTYRHQERLDPKHDAQPPGPFGATTEDNWILTRWPDDSETSLDDFCQRFAGIRPLVASRIDDTSLKKEELVRWVENRPEYEWITLQELFGRMPRPTETIAPESGDFRVRMPWGYRGNELFDLSRQAEIAVLTAERLFARTLAEDLGSPRSQRISNDHTLLQQEITRAWKDLLVGQHHDVQITRKAGPIGRARLLASLERSRDVMRVLLSTKAGNRDDPTNFVVFNPLPWPREEAEAELPDGTCIAGPVHAPSLGFAPLHSKILSPVPRSATDRSLTIETDTYQARFDPQGGIHALTLIDGTALLRTDQVSGRLTGVIDGQAHEGRGSVVITSVAAGWRVMESGHIGPLPYTIEWLLPRHGTRIDCRIGVSFDGEMVGAPTSARDDHSCFTHEKKLRMRFFPAIELSEAVGIHDVPFGVATTDRPYIEGNYWTALGSTQGGLAVANRGTMGSVREQDGAFSVPLAFTTHYWWGREILEGERKWTLGWIPWRGDWRRANLHRRALEFAFPLVAVPGTLRKATTDFLRVDEPDVHLTAFYVENGHGYARFFNGCNESRSFHLPAEMMGVDLRHNEEGPCGPEVTLGPWKVITLRVW